MVSQAQSNRSRRRWINMLLDPMLQLKLPVQLLLTTIAFAALFALHGYLSYQGFYNLASLDPSVDEMVSAQTSDFAFMWAVIGIGYVLCVVAISLVHGHRMIGPTVAFRRHVEALKNGDYSSRVKLREGDAFAELAGDLNELAELLQVEEKRGNL